MPKNKLGGNKAKRAKALRPLRMAHGMIILEPDISTRTRMGSVVQVQVYPSFEVSIFSGYTHMILSYDILYWYM